MKFNFAKAKSAVGVTSSVLGLVANALMLFVIAKQIHDARKLEKLAKDEGFVLPPPTFNDEPDAPFAPDFDEQSTPEPKVAVIEKKAEASTPVKKKRINTTTKKVE